MKTKTVHIYRTQLKSEHYDLYEQEIQRILTSYKELSWQTIVSGMFHNKYTLKIRLLTTEEVATQFKDEVKMELGLELEETE